MVTILILGNMPVPMPQKRMRSLEPKNKYYSTYCRNPHGSSRGKIIVPPTQAFQALRGGKMCLRYFYPFLTPGIALLYFRHNSQILECMWLMTVIRITIPKRTDTTTVIKIKIT